MNKTRCPWCGKLIDKEADAEKYRKKYFYFYLKITFGRHYGICSHCGKIYNNVPRSALISMLILLGLSAISAVFPILLYLALVLIPVLVLISSRNTHFKRIDDNNSGVVKYDEKLKFKALVLKRYYKIHNTVIYPLFSSHDEQDPFSSVSPIAVSSYDEKTGELVGYWLYEHYDNIYFSTLDCVHLYDDKGNVVADITFNR